MNVKLKHIVQRQHAALLFFTTSSLFLLLSTIWFIFIIKYNGQPIATTPNMIEKYSGFGILVISISSFLLSIYTLFTNRFVYILNILIKYFTLILCLFLLIFGLIFSISFLFIFKKYSDTNDSNVYYGYYRYIISISFITFIFPLTFSALSTIQVQSLKSWTYDNGGNNG